MIEIQDKRKSESLKSGDYSYLIRKRLSGLKVMLTTETDAIPTDLGDIQELCNKYLYSIEILLSHKIEGDKKLTLEIFNNIYNDLYIHLDYHLKSLKKPLDMKIKAIRK